MFFFEHYGIDDQEFFSVIELVNQNFPVHFHRAAELICVEEGEVEVTIENESWAMRKGQCAFVFPNQMHEIFVNHQARLQVVVFSPEWIGNFFTRFKGQVPVKPIISLASFYPESKRDSFYFKKSFLYGLCDDLILHTTFKKSEYPSKTKVIQSIMAYVDEHYMENINLKQIASLTKYDYFYLSKLFKQVTNYRFTEYLNQYRISQACYQLRGTQKSISDIALDCGYQNLRTFHRNFFDWVQCTPSEYRLYK